MSPESLAIITKAIDEVNKKVISEAEMDGIEKGRKDTTEKIAKALKNELDIPKISEATGLSIEEIENL